MKKADEKIKKILERNIQDLNKRVQKAELLARNSTFLRQLSLISKRFGSTFFAIKDMYYDNQQIKKLREESNQNILLKLDYPKTKRCREDTRVNTFDQDIEDFKGLECQLLYNPRTLSDKIENKLWVFDNYLHKWEKFCRRWGIDKEWGGKIKSLSNYQRGLADITRQERLRFSDLETTLKQIPALWAKSL